MRRYSLPAANRMSSPLTRPSLSRIGVDRRASLSAVVLRTWVVLCSWSFHTVLRPRNTPRSVTPALPFCHVSLTASRPPRPAYPKELRTLGDHLRKKRLDLGLFQKDVAQQLGVDTASVTNWEKGHTSPRLPLIPRVTEFLGYVPFSAGEVREVATYRPAGDR